MTTGDKLYEGKAKIVYATDDPDVLLTYFKRMTQRPLTPRSGAKFRIRAGVNCTISTHLFRLLEAQGVPTTHWIETPTERRNAEVKALTIIPLEVRGA